MKHFKREVRRICAYILIVAMVVSLGTGAIPMEVLAEQNNETQVTMGDMGQGYSVEGTTSVGNLLADELMQTSDMLTEGAGYNIYSIAVEGQIATVEYSTLQDCILMVVIYDEEGTQLIGSGTEDILAEENQARVCIDMETMPTYFMVKAYMLDHVNMKPLNQEYSSPLYTESMQKLLNSTVDDYRANRVLQLSNDRTTNFMVFEDSTIRVESDEYTNVVTDQGDGSYKVENSDSTIKELKVGEIAAIGDEENLTIIKVKSIAVDGDTVTITEDEVELEEVFSHVKVENFADGENAVVDEATCPQGVTYVGDTKDEIPALTQKGKNVYVDGNFEADFSDGIKVTGNFKFGKKFEIGEKSFANGKGTAKGDVTFSVCTEFKLLLTGEQKFVELTIGIEGALNVELKGDLLGGEKGEIPFPVIYVPTAIGITFNVQPKILIEANVELNLSAAITGKIGFRYDSTAYDKLQGIFDRDISFLSASIEGTLGIGFGIEVSTNIISEKLLEIGVLGAIMTRSQIQNNPKAYNHTCEVCFSGSTDTALEAEPILEFLEEDVLKKDKDIEAEVKVVGARIPLGQWYLSVDNFKFGLGECPYTEIGAYPLEFTVTDGKGNNLRFVNVFIEGKSAEGEEINGRYVTDANGRVYVPELPIGGYDIKLTKTGYRDALKYIKWNYNKILPTMYMYKYENEYSEDITVGEDSKVYELAEHRDGYLEELILKNDNYIYSEEPFKNSRIGKVTIKDGVTKIPDGLFKNCIIDEIDIPNSVVEIGNYAFSGAKLPEKMELGANVNKVGSYAFWRTDVEIPCVEIGEETVLEEFAFSGITIGEVKLLNDASKYKNYLYENYFDDNLRKYFYKGAFTGTQIGKVSFDANVTEVPRDLFKESKIQEISIPETVNYIQAYAFYKADLPDNFELGKRENEIGIYDLAFGETFLKRVVIDGDNYYGSRPFYGCTIENVEITNCASGESGSIFECATLGKVTISPTVEVIGDRMFLCSNIKEIKIPNTVRQIDAYAFQYATLPDGMNLHENIVYQGSGIFCGTQLNKVSINVGSRYDLYTFRDAQINELTLMYDEEKDINRTSNMFNEAVIQKVIITDKVKRIPKYFFSNANIKEINIPDTLEVIDSAAFEYATLPKITFVNGILYKQWLFGSAKIEELTLHQIDDEYVENCPSSCAKIKKVIISDDVSKIPNYIFRDNSIENIVIPGNVKEIGRSAFGRATLPADFKVPASVIVGFDAFGGSTYNYIPPVTSSQEVMQDSSDNPFEIISSPNAEQEDINNGPDNSLSAITRNGSQELSQEGISQAEELQSVTSQPDTPQEIITPVKTQAKNATLTGLRPNDIYNFYSVKEKEDYMSIEDILSPDNVLYITQVETDAEGKASVTYSPREEGTPVVEFATSMSRYSIADAKAPVENIFHTGDVYEILPTVIKDGKTLDIYEDYSLVGDYEVSDIGKYQIGIYGENDYCGAIIVDFQIFDFADLT